MRGILLGGLMLAGLAGPVQAETATYNVSFAGIRAGILAFDGSEKGGRYAVNGAARPSGMLKALFDASVDTHAAGRVQGNSYRPANAREITRDDGDTVTRTVRFSGSGVPSYTRTPPRKKPPEHAAPAAQQKGTVDTTTAAYAILRDRPAHLACKLDIEIFDGAKRHRIRLHDAAPTRNGLTCSGTYSRVAGFSPEDMAERVNWPLTMDYEQMSNGTMRVTGLTFPTSFGKARIRRR
ncbi:DUF3108 domain-containing protein [Meridianimarinicoccus sp. MJW13]|uniref:DUF3108 domain-containing protein n=1 Tax=Meridianimarinicoccus sp. MJW13 TaxID=2720031 RepID=UPI00186771A6|nr:DUF3108 domain-containing protein [Fluviibacterium sp. MJW13]